MSEKERAREIIANSIRTLSRAGENCEGSVLSTRIALDQVRSVRRHLGEVETKIRSRLAAIDEGGL